MTRFPSTFSCDLCSVSSLKQQFTITNTLMDTEWVRGPELGRGSFATVDLAVPSSSSSQFPPLMVVKSSHSYASATLKNEKQVLDKIGACPHVIRCFGEARSVERGEELYNLFLEYASGGSLADRVRNCGGNLPEADVRRYARSMLEGLFHVHDRGFVHCDVKLQNVLVFHNGDIKIADFGLAKKAGDLGGDSKFDFRGTPLYMSPESVNGNEYESPADIWALGCAVVEMLTGKPAWRCCPGSNIYSLMMRIGAGGELPEIPKELSEEGKDFLGKIFVKDSRKRWTAEELLDHPFVSGEIKLSDEVSESPRDPFDFPDWVSPAATEVSLSEFDAWFDKEEQNLNAGESPAERIRNLASGGLNWSVSESWVTVRGS